jgi:hypothetical protein
LIVSLANEELSEKDDETQHRDIVLADPLWRKGQEKVKKECQIFHTHLSKNAKNVAK